MKKPPLPSETDTHYFTLEPVYERYKTVKVKEYCDCCGHYTGFHEEQRGVHLISWEVNKRKKDSMYHMTRVMDKMMKPVIDDFFKAPTLASRFLKQGKSTKGQE